MKAYKFSFRFLIMAFTILTGCQTSDSSKVEQWKNEILETEKAFSDMAEKEGIPQAFLKYASDNVVLNRSDSLIIGKEGLQHFYNRPARKDLKIDLSWKPDFVDVSSAGDLGYTYGTYLYTVTDSIGKVQQSKGIFHTVWKKQDDGQWRFVWD